MRLIDADALRKEVRELPNENTDFIYLDLVDREVVQALISEAPTVERPHGEWIVIHNALGKTKYKCSQCQHYVRSGDDKNFCPNCGADMRKEGDSDA